SLSLDPILWIPMHPIERCRFLRWRLGWFPGGSPRPCLCEFPKLTKQRAYLSLHMSPQVNGSVSNLINRLPHTPHRSHNTWDYWQTHWTALQRLLYQYDTAWYYL
ncbi:MAG: hypothetical protein EXX96DRAFT_485070, partial [Benjaminiella poitrasii]